MSSFYFLFHCGLLFIVTCCSFFTVHGQQGEQLTVGILTDCQYCNCEPGDERFYRYSLHKLDSCIVYFNSQNLDAVFHLGDIIDHGFSNYDSVVPRFHKFSAPVFFVMGNHDYSVKDEEKKEVLKKLEMKDAYY